MTGDIAPRSKKHIFRLALVCACVMAMGWGIRGSYGHCTGARMPGALLGLALAACMLGNDAWKRAPVLGMLGAIGWAFGGQSSYGILIGYSMGGTYTNSLYGFFSLFVVGSVWGGIGAGVLSLGFTKSRAWLTQFIVPMIAIYITWVILAQTGTIEKAMERYESDTWLYDSYWVEALAAGGIAILFHAASARMRNATTLILLIVLGWFAGMFILVHLMELRINPPRNDSWAGCIGVLVVLFSYFARQRDRTALTLIIYGFIGGGLGFAIGDFIQMLGRGQWGPIATSKILQQLNYWTVMEQSFGFIMGLVVALGVAHVLHYKPLPAVDENTNDWLNMFSMSVIFGPVLWDNFKRNFYGWREVGKLPEDILGLSAGQMMFVMTGLIYLVILYALNHHRKNQLDITTSPLGNAQLLLVTFISLVMTIQFSTHRIHAPNIVMFTVESVIAILLLLNIRNSETLLVPTNKESEHAPLLGRGLMIATLLTPLILLALAWMTMSMDMDQNQYRFK